jgi:hypothetical protein
MSRRPVQALVALAVLTAGCSLFKFNVSTPETRRREAEAEARKAEDDALVGELEALRGELVAAPSAEKAMLFADKVKRADGSAPVRDGRLDLAKLQAEAMTYLEQAATAGPSLEAFGALASLPPSPDTDAAVLRACPKVRPAAQGDALVGLVDACLAAAKGDAKLLKWSTAKADVAAFKKAEEARVKAEAKAAAEAAELAKKSGGSAIASVFAAGRCEFGNCLKDGWTARTDAGEVRVRCNFGNCLKDGWTAQLPDGGQANTRCNFGDCMKDGWETSFPNGGGTARTRCNFGKCATDGWETELPNGAGTARTRCNFGDCMKDGWETNFPDGHTVRCRCNFGKCLTDGTSCD